MKILVLTSMAVAFLAALACRSYALSSGLPPLQTVASVDLQRYLGDWFEIARYPNSFQKGCQGSAARYALREDGEINVINSCRDATDGRLRQASGRAWVVDPASNARLKVTFFWPFRGDYWIIDLGSEYKYAVIGTPNRKYLWILSRSRQMNDDVYAAIVKRITKQGFDPTLLVRDDHSVHKDGN